MVTLRRIRGKSPLRDLKKKSLAFSLQPMWPQEVWIFHPSIWLFKWSHQKTPRLTFTDQAVPQEPADQELALLFIP